MSFSSTVTFAVCCIWIAVAGALASGDDRIWLEPQRPTGSQSGWYPRAIEQLTGRVIEFDAEKLRLIRSGDDSETVVAAKRVLWIRPEDVPPLEAEAIELFVAGKYAQSLLKLPEVLKQRPPVWRQQWITMLASHAAWKSSRSEISLELVSQLDRRPLPPLAIAWLPIAWRGGRQSSETISAAQSRMSDPSPAVRLVAASWLLASADRSRAADSLKQLSTHQRPEVKQLASVLLWRVATPPQVIESARRWQTKLEDMPMVLQVGPTKMLIDKLRSAGQSTVADRWQWSLDLVPIHPHPE